MRAGDLPSVQAIEASVQTVPWDMHIFQDCLKVGYDCWIVEQKKEIIAFAILNLTPSTKEAHLMNLGVKTIYQQQGIGKFLLCHLLQYAREQINVIILEVRRSNKIALKLYQRLGFKIIGERKGYYPASIGREDAIVLSFQFNENLG